MAIRAKLVIIVFVFAILPMFLLTARWSATSVGSITASLRARLDERAREIARKVDETLRARAAELSRLADAPTMKSYLQTLARTETTRPDAALKNDLGAFILARQQQYASLVCVNRAGQPLFHVENETDANGFVRTWFSESGFSEADLKLAAEALKTARPDVPLVSEIEHQGGRSFLRVAIPLKSYSAGSGLEGVTGNTVGALVARLHVEQLMVDAVGPQQISSTSIASKMVTPGRSALILDRGGFVLYAADARKQGIEYQRAFPEYAPAIASAIAPDRRNNSDNDVYPALGSDWLIRTGSFPLGAAPQELKSPKLSILMIENRSEATRNLELAGLTMYLLTFVLAIVLTLLLYYLISRVTDQIRRVTRGARAVTAGHLEHRIQIRTEDTSWLTAGFNKLGDALRRLLGLDARSLDETHVLADAFNRMAARLREMIVRESEQKQFESFARLSAVLTHDLKNSIFSLSLLVQNMERKFDREGFREDAMRTLSRSVNDLQSLVARLSDPLAQSHLRQAADLSEIVERVLQRIAVNMDSSYQVSSSLLPYLTANVDARAIDRVIENLLINAIEAMPNGGRLSLSTRVENEAAIISVTDTGRGMSEEFIRERLFRPFATTKKKGIGLGLYSCRDLIEQHGGKIEVSSQLDAGTEFRVILPLAPESVKTVEEKETVVV